MSAVVARIRVLLLTADSQVLQAVRVAVEGFGYVLRSASLPDEVFSRLRSHLPDVVVLAEAGTPNPPLGEILKTVHKISPGLPIIVLGKRRKRPSAGLAAFAGAAYLWLGEIERLPSAIERTLREQQVRKNRTRLRVVTDRAAQIIARNQKLATIGQLMGSIAHEINNPLEAVSNLLFLMEHDTLPPSVREYLALAQRELDRVIRISKQTLNFYRESPTPVRVALGGLLDEVLVLYSRRIAQKQLEVVRQLLNDHPVVVFPGEMRQVFSNLISNAIEASPEGGKLHLRLRRSRFWGDSKITGMRITIADEGAGIPAKIRRRVGEPFFTTKGETGTGLGLWVTQSIVRNYGGNLLLRSNTGKRHGTVFTVFLPNNLRPQVVTRRRETTATGHPSAVTEDSRKKKTGVASGSHPLAS